MIPLHNAKCYWKNIYTHTSSGIPCLEVHKWILHTFPAFPDLHRNPPPNIWLKAWHFSPLHCLARNVLMFSRRDSAAYSSPLLSFFFFFSVLQKGNFTWVRIKLERLGGNTRPEDGLVCPRLTAALGLNPEARPLAQFGSIQSYTNQARVTGIKFTETDE